MNVYIKKLSKQILIFAGFVCLTGLVACKPGPSQVMPDGEAAAAQAPEVAVIKVRLQSVPWLQTYSARIESPRQVDVRPRVSGMLLSRWFEEGDSVAQGALLFQIDPKPYQLALERAEADLSRAQAQERQSIRDRERTSQLFATNAISEKQYEDAQSSWELAVASRQAAEAGRNQAQLNLDYTEVRSPMPGMMGMQEIDEGNLVSPSDTIVRLTQIDPLHVLFSLPPQDPMVTMVREQHAAGEAIRITLVLQDGRTHPITGLLEFVDSGVTQGTGALRLRAVVSNEEATLLHGQLLRVRFEGKKLPPMAVVPEEAVVMTAQGPLLFLVSPEGLVQPRPVVLGPVMEEGQLVEAGLQEGDQVITTSLIRLRPGMPVRAKEQP